MSSKLNNANASLSEIESWFPKFQEQQYKPTYVDVTKPTLRSNDQLLDEFGLDKDKYSLEGMQNALDTATYNAWDNLKDSLTSARDKTIKTGAESFRSMQDTLQDRYDQGVELGIAKQMTNTNLLSTMLGTSQANQQMLQNLDATIGASSANLQDSLLANKEHAQEQYNSLAEFLSKTAEQIYKGEIKQSEAEQKYNEAVTQAANKYAQSTYNLEENYNLSVGKLASSIYKNNKQSKALIDRAAKVASTADEVAQAYVKAAERRAQATISSASYSGYTVYTKSTDYSDILKQFFKYNSTIKDADSFIKSLKSVEASL
jgi:hypothetical protein